MSEARAVAEHLSRNRRLWLPHVFREGRVKGGYFQVGSVDGRRGDSLNIPLSAGKPGIRDFGKGGWKGDDLNLLADGLRIPIPEAIAYAQDHFGAPKRFRAANGRHPRRDGGVRPAEARRPPADPEHAPVATAPRGEIPPPPTRHPTLGAATFMHEYTDGAGRTVCFMCRFDPKPKGEKPRKIFLPLHWNGEAWVWQDPPGKLPLYNLADLLARPDAPVAVAEGEKKCDIARELFPDSVWTTWAHGAQSAGKSDWSPVAGRALVLLPDHNAAGARAMEIAASAAFAAGAASMRRVVWPTYTPDGWDIGDEPEPGLDLDTIARLIDSAPAVPAPGQAEADAPGFMARASTIEPKPVSFLWFPYIVAEHIAIIGGRGGRGKGLVCASLVASATTRLPWPDGTDSGEPADVLWAEAEDPRDQAVVPRLIAAGADRERVTIVDTARFMALDLRRHILDTGTRLVVLSPLLSFLKGLADKNDEMAVRVVLEALVAAVAGTSCAIYGIAHLNKKPDLIAIERLLGSVAFGNYGRVVHLVSEEPDDAGAFRLVHEKHNLSVKGRDLIYRPANVGEDQRSQYIKLGWSVAERNVDGAALFDRRKADPDRGPTATDWLIRYLTEHGESLREAVVVAGGLEGFTDDALEKAAYRCRRIKTRREGAFHARTWWGLA